MNIQRIKTERNCGTAFICSLSRNGQAEAADCDCGKGCSCKESCKCGREQNCSPSRHCAW